MTFFSAAGNVQSVSSSSFSAGKKAVELLHITELRNRIGVVVGPFGACPGQYEGHLGDPYRQATVDDETDVPTRIGYRVKDDC